MALMTELGDLAALMAERNEAWTAEHIRLSEIAAPPFAEAARGEAMAAAFAEHGLVDIATDAVGNVAARFPGRGGEPRLAVSAHLDTVFGADVDVRVSRDGDILRGPGIGDDASGLILLLALADVLAARGVDLPGELWLVATVGEEGAGNLRGAREMAVSGAGGRPFDAFITLDTACNGQIIRHGTHSSNHMLTVRGPGGHAWGEFGVANPNFIVARIVAAIGALELPEAPRCTLNCGLLHGGFAPNAIPGEASAHINLRSEEGATLERLVGEVKRCINEQFSAAAASRRRGPEPELAHTLSGRPGGETPVDSPLVRAAVAAASARDWSVSHPHSSTDANAFMARGIDAICLYRGDGGGEHTTDEWYDASTRPAALSFLAETVLRWFELA